MKLLEKGIHPDVSTIRLNQTPSHIAAFGGNSHCLKWLLHCGTKIDRQVNDQTLPIMIPANIISLQGCPSAGCRP